MFKARQPRFGRTVAVKVLDPGADPLSVQRFERECEAMGMLSSHPNIVTIFDAGVADDGKPFLIMEFMPDGSLDDRLASDGPMRWDEVADVGVKLAGALHTAHEASVLHRDVKPANVLRSPFGEPCLSDFGLARFGDQAKTTGVVTATLLHAPPEILAGRPATPRSDVYSLGSSLFTLLVGDAPFWQPTDESMLPLLARIADEPVPDLRPRGVPDALASAIEAALAKDPAARPGSAADFGRLLQEAQESAGRSATALPLAGQASVQAAREVATAPTDPDQTIVRPRPSPTPIAPTPEPAPARKRRWPLAVAALVVIAALAVGAVLVLGGGDDGGPTTVGDASGDGNTADMTAAGVVDGINAHRASVDLAPLTVDPDLADEAQGFAEQAAAAGAAVTIDPNRLNNRNPNQWARVWANQVPGSTVADGLEASVDQDQLRVNLEKPGADVVGIGSAVADDGTVWLVELLAQSNA